MKNKDYPIEKKLRYKLYITLALYVVIGFVLTLLLGYIFTLSKNPVIAWLYWRMDALFIFISSSVFPLSSIAIGKSPGHI